MSENQKKEYSESSTPNESQPLKEKSQNTYNNKQMVDHSDHNEFCGKLINFSDGLSSFSNLAITFYFKENLNLSPSQSALIQSILSFPRIFKPFFGFISDVFPFFGYKRKSYLFFNSLISKNKKHEKDDKKLEKFNTSIIYINLGTILSSTTRGIALEYFSNQKMFFISGIMSFLDIIAAVIYKEEKFKVKECGDESNDDINKDESFSYNRKDSCKKLFEIIKRREIVLLSVYMMVMTLVPSYYESSFYYLSDKKGFTKRNFGHLTIILMVLFLINSVINKNYLNKYSKKKVIIYMTIISFLFSSLYHIYIYFDLSSKLIVFIGVSLYISFKSLGVKPIFNLAFLACPKGYEGSIMGLFYSLRDFGDTCASLMGSWMAYFLDIQRDGYKNFSKMVFIINLISLLPIAFIRIINDKSIISLQENKN